MPSLAKGNLPPMPTLPKWAAAVLSLACGVAGVLTLYAIAGLPLPFAGVAVASTEVSTANGGAVIQLAVTVAGAWIAWVSYSLHTMHTDLAMLKADVAGLKTDVAGLQTAMAGLTAAIAGLKRRR